MIFGTASSTQHRRWIKMEINTFKDFEEFMNKAYIDGNFHDSQNAVEELKKKYPIKEVISFINKQLETRKNNEKMLEIETKKLEEKYSPRKVWIWNEALDYVTHKYQKGEYIFFYYDGITSGRIEQLTKKGYKVFVGRKLGVVPEIPFSHVICHISNTKRILEELKINEQEQKEITTISINTPHKKQKSKK
jgi:hypothetical protein